jgi:hypothetical protein
MNARVLNDTLINLTKRVDAGEFSEALSGAMYFASEKKGI